MPHAKSITLRAVRYEMIEGFPGYRVGDDGSVWSCWKRGGTRSVMTNTWLPLKGSPQSRGHLIVCLIRDGEKFYRFVHQLVLTAFVGPCPLDHEACHDPDPDPSNNRLENLRWGTRKENYEDSVRHGTAYLGKVRLGEENPSSKLTRDLVLTIMRIRCDEGLGAKLICRSLGLPDAMRGAVDGIIRGQSWNDVTGLPPYKTQSHKLGRRPTQMPVEESRDANAGVSGSDNVAGQKWTQARLW